MGFTKIIWKALELPVASCLLKRAQEVGGLLCLQKLDPSILLQFASLNPATL